MMVKKQIGDCWVLILVDTRCTRNFIDPTIVTKTSLGIIGGDKVLVQIANGWTRLLMRVG